MPDSFVRNVPKAHALAAAGIGPKSIDIVVLSHLHPDHINGIRDASGGLAFPNAELKAPSADWAFWMSDDNMAKAQDNAMMKGYFANTRKVLAGLAAKVAKYNWGQEVAPGITALDTSGHTPGHTSFAVSSGSGKLLVQSDVTNIPELFLRNPEWHVAFDVDPVKAVATRRRFYDMAAADKTPIRRLPLLVAVDGLRREGRHQLSAGPGSLEPGALRSRPQAGSAFGPCRG